MTKILGVVEETGVFQSLHAHDLESLIANAATPANACGEDALVQHLLRLDHVISRGPP